ncbi:MAG: hypothetical protein GX418_01470 [Clostridiales bacterium]|nr:hypothetical protein [Clostridiales bacterium]
MSKRSFSSRVKITFLKGMEALGTSASNLASNAKLRVIEINLQNRRREILTDFSLQAFELWQKGVQLPGTLSEMLKELSDIEERLTVLRAQKYAKVAADGTAGKGQGAKSAPAAPPVPVECSLQDDKGTEEPATCAVEGAESADAAAGANAGEGAQPEGEEAPAEDAGQPETDSVGTEDASAERPE